MRFIWNVVNGIKVMNTLKNKMFLGLLILVNILIGGGLWCLFGRLFFPGIDVLICFMGYPAVFIGFFGGVLYLYSHDFT